MVTFASALLNREFHKMATGNNKQNCASTFYLIRSLVQATGPGSSGYNENPLGVKCIETFDIFKHL